jgi:hypothetical protein
VEHSGGTDLKTNQISKSGGELHGAVRKFFCLATKSRISLVGISDFLLFVYRISLDRRQ